MDKISYTTKEQKKGTERKFDKFYQKAVGMFNRGSEEERAEEGITETENAVSASGQEQHETETAGQDQEKQPAEKSMKVEEPVKAYAPPEEEAFKAEKDLLTQKEATLSAEEVMNRNKKTITFTLFLSADKMAAYIRAQDYQHGKDADNRIPTSVIYDLLKEKGVVYGMDQSGIEDYCQGRKFYKDFQVATGARPKAGEDGRVEYLFSLDVKYAPEEKDDGTVDYKELGMVRNVEAGDVLCRITPPTEGLEGVDVLGKAVKPAPGRPVSVNYGKGVQASEDGLEYIAIESGMVELNGGTVEVKEIYTINGDVGPATGNIRFNGTVMVKGSVLSDYAIYAKGDIIVNGYVESSILNAAGNIVIKNGISGMKKGLLKADGDVTVRFAEMARIVAGGDFHFDYCINCDVKVGASIIGKGKRGSLLGGNYIAGTTIDVNIIGSDLNIPMEVQIVPDWQEVKNFKLKPEDRIKENKELVCQWEKEYSDLKHKYDSLDSEISRASRRNSMDAPEDIEAKHKKVVHLMDQKSKIRQQMTEIEEKKESVNRMASCEGCMVIARKMAHAGARITIGNAMLWIHDTIKHQTFVEENGLIETHSITPGSV